MRSLPTGVQRVALLIETSRAYGRGLLRGVAGYRQSHGAWSIWHQERSLNDPPPKWLQPGMVDGVVARLDDSRLVEAVLRLGVPVVDLRGRFSLPEIPLIESDDQAIARLAADHLLERGFESFAFCGYEGANYSDRRLLHFRTYLQDRGFGLYVHLSPRTASDDDTTAGEEGGVVDEALIATWLEDLPRPLGLFACNDIRGQQVLNACREHGILVPEEVAVIGVDNDIMLCELSAPPLSTVVPDTEKIGWEACMMLDRMMRRGASEPSITLVGPLGTKTRQSTDTFALADSNVAAAVRFIWDHACTGLTVQDVVKGVAISRSTLERKFQQSLGRTPKEEILRVQMDRVRSLLINTEYSLAAIASMTGFRHPEYLSVAFRREAGETPISFRRRVADQPRRSIDLVRLSDHD